MPSRKDMYFRNLLTLSLALLFPVIMAAQSGARLLLRIFAQPFGQATLGQTLSHSRQTPAATATQSQPAPFDQHSRDDAHPTSPLQPVRLPGAPAAAERYVFGRMDLATGTIPPRSRLAHFRPEARRASRWPIIVIRRRSRYCSPMLTEPSSLASTTPREWSPGYRGSGLQWRPQPGFRSPIGRPAPFRFSWAMATARSAADRLLGKGRIRGPWW